ncbi:MAG: primosomal protein N' [Myxococcota bacterium]
MNANQPKTAEVAVFGAVKETLTYSVPDELAGYIRLGQGVIVPLMREKRGGIIWSLDAPYDRTINLKPIIEVLDSTPLITPDIIALLRTAADYYHAPPGELSRFALPPGRFAPPSLYIKKLVASETAFQLTGDSVKRARTKLEQLILDSLEQNKFTSLDFLAKKLGRSASSLKNGVFRLEERGLLSVTREGRLGVAAPKLYKALSITDEGRRALSDETLPKNAHAQRAVLTRLLKEGPVTLGEMNRLVSSASTAVKKLIEAGYIEATLAEYDRKPISRRLKPLEFELNEHQKRAFAEIADALNKKSFEIFLLYGVTGSGKTEVYLRAVEKTLNEGGGAIVLVPEIALTSNLARQAEARFGDAVRVIHSRLSVGERADAWRRIMRGESRVVIGPRSAVFAPVNNLRLIVVDEEHDPSYKQEESVRYNGVHLALLRAQREKLVCVLGSATPSIESFYYAKSGKYKLLTLPERVEKRALPGVDVVDLRGTSFSPHNPLSERLKVALVDVLSRREQAILFVNRRGYAFFLVCGECGNTFECPRCAVSLVFHSEENSLKCHYCGYEEKLPEVCPKCNSENVKHFGIGVERIEEYIRKRWATARLARLDRDAIARKSQLEEVLAAMEERRLDILVGTQMVAKGHDFPGVTLVGIIAADTGMNLPDFRAAERLFQLLTQVSGRAGRGDKAGKVVLQTFNPGHYAIKTSSTADYEALYRAEVEIRKKIGYPPFARLCLIRAESESEQDARFAMQYLAEFYMRSKPAGSWLLGPIASPIKKLRNTFRYQCLLKTRDQKLRKDIVSSLIRFADAEIPSRVKIIFDIDPVNML